MTHQSTAPRPSPEGKRLFFNMAPARLVQAVVVLALLLAFTYHAVDSPTLSICKTASSATAAGWQDTLVSTASQGKLWKPVASRTFTHTLHFQTGRARTQTAPPQRTGPTCARWAVVTTIFEPTTLLRQLRAMRGWCLVVVGDHKTNDTQWENFASVSPKSTVYLSEAEQDSLPYGVLQHVPWNHFGRKNVGYVYAVHHGAELIWDTDDDNDLQNPADVDALAAFATATRTVPIVDATHHIWNPYPYFKPVTPSSGAPQDVCWPRGLPLPYVKDNAAATTCDSPRTFCNTSDKLPSARVAVFQSLADNDPDVDALYRLTRPIPLSFPPASASSPRDIAPVALPKGRVAPFNAQATLWTRQAFWGLLLPVSVHGRVSDIWRSYFTQRMFSDTDLHLAFTRPLAIQYRNVHSLVADLQAEVPLYTQADELVKWLLEWRYDGEHADVLETRVEKLMVDLFEIGVIEKEDVLLMQAWLKDLRNIGYEFSAVNTKPRDRVREAPEADGRHVARVANCMRVDGAADEVDVRKRLVKRDGDADVDAFVIGDAASVKRVCDELDRVTESCTAVMGDSDANDGRLCVRAVRDRAAGYGAYDWVTVQLSDGGLADVPRRNKLVLKGGIPVVWVSRKTDGTPAEVSGRADWVLDALSRPGGLDSPSGPIDVRTLSDEM